jgi:hypothetical protein
MPCSVHSIPPSTQREHHLAPLAASLPTPNRICPSLLSQRANDGSRKALLAPSPPFHSTAAGTLTRYEALLSLVLFQCFRRRNHGGEPWVLKVVAAAGDGPSRRSQRGDQKSFSGCCFYSLCQPEFVVHFKCARSAVSSFSTVSA